MTITTPSYRPDPARTGISLAVQNREMIADLVLPRVPVDDYTFQWNKFNLADQFTLPDMIMGRAGTPNTVEFGITRETGSVLDFGLGAWIPEVDRRQGLRIGYDPLDANVVTLTKLMLLRHEKMTADVVFDLNTYPAANRATLSGTSQFSNAASTPYDTIMNALEVPLMRPNVLVFNRPGLIALRRHAQITAMISTTGSGNSETTGAAGRPATNQQLAELFEVDEVVVGNATVNTAGFGEAVVMARCWGNHMAALYRGTDIVSTTGNDTTFGYVAELGTRDAYIEFDAKRGRHGSYFQWLAETKRPIIAAADQAYFLQNII